MKTKNRYYPLVSKVFNSYGMIINDFKGCWVGDKYMVAVVDSRYIKICLDTFAILENRYAG